MHGEVNTRVPNYTRTRKENLTRKNTMHGWPHHQESLDRVGGRGAQSAVRHLKVVQAHIVERRDEQLDRRVANLVVRKMEGSGGWGMWWDTMVDM